MKYQIVTHRNGEEHAVSDTIQVTDQGNYGKPGDPAEHIVIHAHIADFSILPIDLNLSDVITLTFRQVQE